MACEETPILDAYVYSGESRRIHLVVWCRYCGRWHWHGAGVQPGDGDGHRAAHCLAQDSPYLATGYDLQERGTITEAEMQRQARTSRPAGKASRR